MRLRVNLTAWGRHLSTAISYLIPSLLAGGNLPSLGLKHDVVVDFCSTRAGLESLRQITLFPFADVAFHVIDDPTGYNPHDVFSQANNTSLRLMDDGEGCIFLCPDMVLSDGSLRWLSDHVDAQAVVIAGILRTDIHGASNAIEQFRNGDAINVGPRQLMRVLLDHPHRVTQSLTMDNPFSSNWPSQIYWKVGGEGLVARCFHAHPLFVRSRETIIRDTIDGSFLDGIGDILYVTNSDDVATIEMSDPSHMRGTIWRKPMHFKNARKFASAAATKIHRRHAAQSIRCVADMTDPALWTAVESASNDFMAKVL